MVASAAARVPSTFSSRDGEAGAEVVRVVHRQAAADVVAVVEDHRRADVGVALELGMADTAGVDAAWLAEERAHEIHVVDGVVEHLEPGEALEEGPVAPRRVDVEAHLDVGDVAEDAAAEGIAQGEHVGREAELEVDGGGEVSLAADAQDAAGVIEVASHGLLDEDGRAFGHALDDGGDLSGRDGDVEDGAGRGQRFIERGKDAVDGEVGGALLRGVSVDIEDAGDGEVELRGRSGGGRRGRCCRRR